MLSMPVSYKMFSSSAGMNHFWAKNVGIIELRVITPISNEYWDWLINPSLKPKSAAINPKVRPVLIRRDTYIWPSGIYFFAKKYTPENLDNTFTKKKRVNNGSEE